MKTHAIIPIFIPHAGCPHDCVFCNQKAITARTHMPTPADADATVRQWLSTIEKNPDIKHVEIAFYGGSFTAIPMEEQTAYLEIAEKYKKAGAVDSIHMSTRPDYIDDRILDNLAEHGTDVIELGVQSFDDEVLHRAGRGHDSACVYTSSALIKSYGFTLGIQLMSGLPGDSYEKCIRSARETVKIAPAIGRIYPAVVLRDTAMYEMYRRGTYNPPDLEETIHTVSDMYRILTSGGVNVIRVGLKSTDIIKDRDGAVVGGYHPAIRQLVESEIAREDIEAQIKKSGIGSGHAVFSACPESFSNLTGHKKSNRLYFLAAYPGLHIEYKQDKSLAPGVYRARFQKEN